MQQLNDKFSVEKARVVSVQLADDQLYDTVWVESVSGSNKEACEGCNAKGVCGQGVLNHWFAGRQSCFTVSCQKGRAGLLQVGEWVEVAVPQHTLLSAAMLSYLLPLVLMMVAGLSIQNYGGGELSVFCAMIVGLFAGFYIARYMAAHLPMFRDSQPVLVE